MTAHAAEPALAQLAVAYAGSRSVDDLARLHDAVRRTPGFDAGLDVVAMVSPLFARGAHAEVVARVRQLMPGAFLSVRRTASGRVKSSGVDPASSSGSSSVRNAMGSEIPAARVAVSSGDGPLAD